MSFYHKTYDRKLKLRNGKSSITIPAGKTVHVKFKVIGKTTWYKYSDHAIRFYFTFDGKKYLGSVWDDDSSYKDGKRWFGTY